MKHILKIIAIVAFMIYCFDYNLEQNQKEELYEKDC